MAYSMRNISVFGLGYVGAVTAACLSQNGNSVLCVDINPVKVRMLQSGQMISPSPKTYKINYEQAACSKLNQASPHVDSRASVNDYFGSAAPHWEDIYQKVTLDGTPPRTAKQ
jgi:UDP-N-acetyl-D-mannosaminuronate dehydrogenase